ncbi:hypothetical protein [Legionella sp.]|uniref:hypothetical protein n=1 Tax=Legionella sp. TaxID=459 RepID=UPI003C835088
MSRKQFALFIGTISIVLSLVTWTMDLNHLVPKCIYCRCERTMIGLLGVLILLPVFPYLTRYFSLVFGFFGASVAAQQIILILKMGSLFPIELSLVVAALFIIIGQVLFIDSRLKILRMAP